jgi:hypothetical protein
MENVKFIGTFQGHPEENAPSIFLVVSVGVDEDLNYKDKRCWGWYSTEEAAREAVKRNAADMHETIYAYAVIERVSSGIPPDTEDIQWFQWTDDPESVSPYGPYNWKECDAPEWSMGIIGWGIG